MSFLPSSPQDYLVSSPFSMCVLFGCLWIFKFDFINKVYESLVVLAARIF